MRKFTATTLAGVVLTSSCAVVKERPITIPKPTVDTTPSVKEVNAVFSFVSESVNHNLPDTVANTYVSFSGGTLEQFCKQAPFKCYVSPELKFKTVPPVAGKVKEVLNLVATLSGSYWTYEDGVVSFTREKLLIYRIPYLSREQLENTYNLSDSDRFSISDSVFGEIEKGLKQVLSSKVHKGELETTYVSTKEKNQLQDNGKTENTQTYSKRKTSTIQNSSKTLGNTSKSTGTSTGETKDTKEDKTGIEKKRSRRTKEPLTPVVKNLKESSTKLSNRTENSYQRSTERQNSEVKERDRERSSLSDRRGYRKVEESLKGTLTEKESYKLKTVIEGKEKVAVFPTAGVVVVRVNRDDEPLVRSFMRNVLKEFSQLVMLKVYILELRESDSRSLTMTLNLLKRSYRHEGSVAIKDSQVNVSFTNLSTDYLQGIAHGINLSSLVEYILSRERGKILTETTLLTLPRTLAVFRDSVSYPYLEPQSVSVGGTNPTLSYDIKYVDDGIKVRIVPTVMGNLVSLALSVEQNKYLGDKTVQAGNLGTITIPIQSPKRISTVALCKAGDILFTGGLEKVENKRIKRINGILPEGDTRESSRSRLLILIQPKIIKFKTTIKEEW